MTDKPPIVVDPNVLGASVAMGIRQIALVGGGAAAVWGSYSSHDWTGLFAYLASDGMGAALVALATIGVFAYGQVRMWRDKLDTLYMARKVDDSVAVVKGEGTTP